VGVRVEDKAEDLKIERLGFGKGVAKKYHILKNQPGPGYENKDEFEAPALETLLKQGFPRMPFAPKRPLGSLRSVPSRFAT
jgi:hypothetical protein